MSKQKINIAGAVFDVTKYLKCTEQFIQDRYDSWLGKDTVKVNLEKPTDNVVEVKIYRTYGSYYKPQDMRTMEPKYRFIFSYDRQFLLGTDYQTGTYADLSLHRGQYIIFDDLETFFREYRKQARELKATRPKELEFEDHLDYMKLTLTF